MRRADPVGPPSAEPGEPPDTVEPHELRDLGDVERAAAAVLPAEVWDFVAGGSGREHTLAANREAFDRVFVASRVLRDVSACDTATTLLGRPVRMPVAVAPVAYQRLVHPEGESASARAARAVGVPFTVGTLSSVPVEEVTAAGGTVWFQLYWLRERGRTLDLARRAEDAGCHALMLTVDVPWMGRRLRDARNRFTLPGRVRAAHLDGGATSAAHLPSADGSAVAAHTAAAFSPAVTWSCVEELRAATRLPLILKGLLAPEDAVRAARLGVDAVVVSNHGGGSSTARCPASTRCPRWPRRSTGRARSWWTAASAAARTYSRRWPWARTGYSWGAHRSGGSRPPGKPGRGGCSTCWPRSSATPWGSRAARMSRTHGGSVRCGRPR
ncbi:hypothetical protein SAV31267_008550 [Streptomyces avermitilis]|uniref:FMN hydroxy acid dehydrogenase domain-containing protein n=1 Tax=Streptomyces avermitilis TaxID=33903 RepID=A0A4D4MH93_STRAX|nr:hypothetical protein SAV31267_008550 [Streptomyces avermitilis]